LDDTSAIGAGAINAQTSNLNNSVEDQQQTSTLHEDDTPPRQAGPDPRRGPTTAVLNSNASPVHRVDTETAQDSPTQRPKMDEKSKESQRTDDAEDEGHNSKDMRASPPELREGDEEASGGPSAVIVK